MMLVHGGVAPVPWLLGLQPPFAAILGTGVLGWGGWQVASHAGWMRAQRLVGLELMADGCARLLLQDGSSLDATLRDVPLSNRMVTLLVFRTQAGRRRNALVWADACPTGQYRRLRVFVRWAEWRRGGEQGSAGSDAPA
jgi:hypothetical protein